MRIIIAVALVLLVAGCVSETAKTQQRYSSVERVIDGDTIKMDNGDTIRLLGINAPDKKEKLYEESSERLAHLVLGKYVRMENDSVNRDGYKRLLRYIFVNNTLVNAEMIREGYAKSYLLQTNLRYAKRLTDAEGYAKSNKLGMWSGN